LKNIVIKKSQKYNIFINNISVVKRPKSKVENKKANQKNTDKEKSVK